MLRLLLLSSFALCAFSVQPGTLYRMTDAAEREGAVCLDGSPGAYYFAPGSGSGARKWIVFHQGGGWCKTLEECAGRSKGTLGSSKSYPDSTDFDKLGYGHLNSEQAYNPQFYNWNKVFMNYCDGGSFSGSNYTVSVYNDVSLHFRGMHVLDSFINDLLKSRGLVNATDLVVSGCSAGGLATYLHIDRWAEFMPPTVRVAAFADSGFFEDYQGVPGPGVTPGHYETDMQWVFLQQNATLGVNRDCISAYPPEQQWKCFFAEHTAPFIKTPFFALQSEYDAYQIDNILATNTSSALIQEFGNNITARLTASLLSNPANGVFLDSCRHHCGSWAHIRIDGDVQSEAFQSWYENNSTKRAWVQGKPYPCDACCSPTTVTHPHNQASARNL